MTAPTTPPLVMVLDRIGPGTVAETRLAVRELVRHAGIGDLADSAALLTTELVADAVAREPDALIVYAECDRRHVRVEVGETGEAASTAARRAPGSVAHGEARTAGALRSRLLDELADGWGSIRTGDGGIVWFDVGIRTSV